MKKNSLALISLVLGLISFAFLIFKGYESVGIITGFSAIVLGREVNKNNEKKSLMAKTGILSGVLGLILCIIATVFFMKNYILSYFDGNKITDSSEEIKDELDNPQDDFNNSDLNIDLEDVDINNNENLDIDNNESSDIDDINSDIVNSSDNTNSNQGSNDVGDYNTSNNNSNALEIARLNSELQIKEQLYSTKMDELKRAQDMYSESIKSWNTSESTNYYNEISRLTSEMSILNSEISDLRQQIFKLEWQR